MRPAWSAVACVIMAAAGCVRPLAVDRVVGPGVDEPLPGASRATWSADPRRLDDDLTRAVQRSHWAVLSTEQGERGTWHGRALMPDGRMAEVFAWSPGKGKVTAVVRVGIFGDPDAQRKFLGKFAKTMCGKAKPKRGGKFELP